MQCDEVATAEAMLTHEHSSTCEQIVSIGRMRGRLLERIGGNTSRTTNMCERVEYKITSLPACDA